MTLILRLCATEHATIPDLSLNSGCAPYSVGGDGVLARTEKVLRTMNYTHLCLRKGRSFTGYEARIGQFLT